MKLPQMNSKLSVCFRVSVVAMKFRLDRDELYLKIIIKKTRFSNSFADDFFYSPSVLRTHHVLSDPRSKND